jgi:hypothetical protein
VIDRLGAQAVRRRRAVGVRERGRTVLKAGVGEDLVDVDEDRDARLPVDRVKQRS